MSFLLEARYKSLLASAARVRSSRTWTGTAAIASIISLQPNWLSSGRLQITAGAAVRTSTISEINAGLILFCNIVCQKRDSSADLSVQDGDPPDSRQQFVPFWRGSARTHGNRQALNLAREAGRVSFGTEQAITMLICNIWAADVACWHETDQRALANDVR
jgi:hypothetical protein